MNIKKIIRNGIFVSLLLVLNPIDSHAINNVKQIEIGAETAFAIKEDGSVWAWGSNYFGELGLSDTKNRYTPTKIEGLDNVKKIITKNTDTFAIKEDGSVWAWGYNSTGGLGLGDNKARLNPIKIESLNNIKKIEVGHNFTVILKNDGTVWTMGLNNEGQLGLSDNKDRNIPTKIDTIENVKDVIAGYNYTILVKEDGTVWSCGSNTRGQLGIGSKDKKFINTPTQIEGLNNIKEIFAGGYHSVALKSDGTLWGWGCNLYGELYLDDREDKFSPTQITKLKDTKEIKSISLGDSNTFLLTNDGTAYAWGCNYTGELGIGSDEEEINQPTVINNVKNIKDIKSNNEHSAILKKDGTVLTAGSNYSGELGLGDTVNRNIFTRVATPEELATENAEVTKTVENIETARDLVNKLPESEEKEELQDRLNKIDPNLEFEVKNTTANLDVYIKSKNMLSLSLNTNNITFDDFSGIQDEEKLNAITLTVNSSLPYDLRVYLPEEIRGSRFNETMDKRIFNIRANGEEEYQTFTDTTNPIILLDNQVEGNKKVHGIDLKLKGNLAHKKDIYKATVKFEVVQK